MHQHQANWFFEITWNIIVSVALPDSQFRALQFNNYNRFGKKEAVRAQEWELGHGPLNRVIQEREKGLLPWMPVSCPAVSRVCRLHPIVEMGKASETFLGKRVVAHTLLHGLFWDRTFAESSVGPRYLGGRRSSISRSRCWDLSSSVYWSIPYTLLQQLKNHFCFPWILSFQDVTLH